MRERVRGAPCARRREPRCREVRVRWELYEGASEGSTLRTSKRATVPSREAERSRARSVTQVSWVTQSPCSATREEGSDAWIAIYG